MLLYNYKQKFVKDVLWVFTIRWRVVDRVKKNIEFLLCL